MTQPIRILHVLGGVNLGGAESRIMDMYRNIDRNKIQFDFLVHTKEKGHFQEEIESLGGKVYSLPRFKLYNMITYKKAWKRFMKSHALYRAVHGHMTSTAGIYLPIAKKAGVPITIAHARSAGTDPGLKGKLTKQLRKNLADKADVSLACSEMAAEAVFGKRAVQEGKVKILPNAIAADKYAFNNEKRLEIRSSLGVDTKTVIGHVGRFHYAKNHLFLLEIFAEIKKCGLNTVMLLLGEGKLMEEAKERAKALGIFKEVYFLGNKENVSDYYQAMDYVIFPSRFEGMPGTIVEAQASGLAALVSDTVTEEVKATDLVTFFSLEQSPKKWAEWVISHLKYDRIDRREELKQKGFDVMKQIKELEQIYQIMETINDRNKL